MSVRVQLVAEAGAASAGEALVVAVWQGPQNDRAGGGVLPLATRRRGRAAAQAAGFVGKAGQSLPLWLPEGDRRMAAAWVGLGPPGGSDAAGALDGAAGRWSQLGGQAVRLATAAGARKLTLQLPSCRDVQQLVAWTAPLVMGLHLGTYRYVAYKSRPRPPAALASVQVVLGQPLTPAVFAALRRAQHLGEVTAAAVAQARDWVNRPAMDLTPAQFAAEVQVACRRNKLSCEVLGVPQLRRAKMNLLLGVGMGSQHGPRLVHLRYQPRAAAAARGTGGPIVLVGKGITFDSGGLCLKPPDGMMGMKVDMGGGAAVLATLLACHRLQLPQPVHGLVAMAENMPSGSALRLGDVLTHASGTTVEINNTDAEGRLVLADALHRAVGLKPRLIVDVATLTGACMVALGKGTIGLFSNEDRLADSLAAAAEAAGEPAWRLPLTGSLESQLDSDIADLRNTGERYGGAITAALFLQHFVGTIPWAHLDIAGPAVRSRPHAAQSPGATGAAVATLLRWLSQLPASVGAGGGGGAGGGRRKKAVRRAR